MVGNADRAVSPSRPLIRIMYPQPGWVATVAATATANYLASHGPRLAPNAVVHGFSVAFAIGAIIVAAGAVASFVLVNAKAEDLSNPAA